MKYEKRGGEMVVDTTDEVIAMGIDANAMAHIMNVLTDLYSNTVLAVIREYSTNALDAHVEADLDDPIEVTVSNEWFMVRDFGAGMDADDIRNVYSRYGASTKRDSNDVVGMLGLGSKSALTYCNEFWVLGIKNGIQTQVKVGRDNEGAGYMNIVLVCETDAPDGVEVSVPIKPGDTNRFLTEAKQFFSYWRENPVLLNGESPTRVDGLRVSENIIRSDSYADGVLVMGNVPYPCPRLKSGVVAWAEIGSVDIAPSREALQYNDKTNQYLGSVQQEYDANFRGAAMLMVANAETKEDALRMAALANKWQVQATFRWNGLEIPNYLRPKDDESFFVVPMNSLSWGGRRKGVTPEAGVYFSTLLTGLFVTGYDKDKVSQYNRDKLDLWYKAKGITKDKIILCNEHPLPDFALPENTFTWDEVRKTKPASTAAKVQRSAETFKRVVIAGEVKYDLPRDQIPTDMPIYYVMKDDPDTSLAVALGTDKFVLVDQLGRNQVNRFKREFPSAVHAVAKFRELAQAWLASLSEEDYKQSAYANMFRYEKRWLGQVDPTKVLDPALAMAVEMAKKGEGRIEKEFAYYRGYVSLSYADFTNPLHQYPLVHNEHSVNLNHFYIYVNGVYTAKKEGRI